MKHVFSTLTCLAILAGFAAPAQAKHGHSSWAVDASFGAYGSGLGVSYYHGYRHGGHSSWGWGVSVAAPVVYAPPVYAPVVTGYYATPHYRVAYAAPVVAAPAVVAAPVEAPAVVDDRPSVAVSAGYRNHHGGIGVSTVIPLGSRRYGDERDSYNKYLESIGSDERSDITWNDRGFRRWLEGKDGDTYHAAAAADDDNLQPGTNFTADGRLKSDGVADRAPDGGPVQYISTPNQGAPRSSEDASTKRYVPSRRQELEEKMFKPNWSRPSGS